MHHKKGSSHLDRLKQDNPRDKGKVTLLKLRDAGKRKMTGDKRTPLNDHLCLLRVEGSIWQKVDLEAAKFGVPFSELIHPGILS